MASFRRAHRRRKPSTVARTSGGGLLGALLALAATVVVAACSNEDGPYLEIQGGGFIFNIREAEAYYGVTLRPLRRLAQGTVIEVDFENPAGGPDIVVQQTVAGPRLNYAFRTPALSGIRKDKNYRALVLVKSAKAGDVLARYEKTFRPNVDQSVLPDKPLFIGPGYTPNPELQRQ